MWSRCECKACVSVCACVCISVRSSRESKVHYFSLGRSKSKVCFAMNLYLYTHKYQEIGENFACRFTHFFSRCCCFLFLFSFYLFLCRFLFPSVRSYCITLWYLYGIRMGHCLRACNRSKSIYCVCVCERETIAAVYTNLFLLTLPSARFACMQCRCVRAGGMN